MKKFIAVFFRSNPEHRNGGYKTRIQIEAKSEKSAIKKAHKLGVDYSVYDKFTFLDIYEEC